MGVLRVDHPDISLHSCKDDGDFTNFNISVAITDEFMAAVRDGEQYRPDQPPRRRSPGLSSTRARCSTSSSQNAWETGEPGMIFIDRMNRETRRPQLGEIESTNPCGEQPLLPYEACNLGSINLARFVSAARDGRRSTGTGCAEVVHRSACTSSTTSST